MKSIIKYTVILSCLLSAVSCSLSIPNRLYSSILRFFFHWMKQQLRFFIALKIFSCEFRTEINTALWKTITSGKLRTYDGWRLEKVSFHDWLLFRPKINRKKTDYGKCSEEKRKVYLWSHQSHGLSGIKLIVSDKCSGLHGIIGSFFRMWNGNAMLSTGIRMHSRWVNGNMRKVLPQYEKRFIRRKTRKLHVKK